MTFEPSSSCWLQIRINEYSDKRGPDNRGSTVYSLPCGKHYALLGILVLQWSARGWVQRARGKAAEKRVEGVGGKRRGQSEQGLCNDPVADPGICD